MGDGKEEKKGGKEVDDAGRGKPKKKKKRDFVEEGRVRRNIRKAEKPLAEGVQGPVRPKKERAGAKGNTNASKKNRENKKSRTIKKSSRR